MLNGNPGNIVGQENPKRFFISFTYTSNFVVFHIVFNGNPGITYDQEKKNPKMV